MTIGMPCPNSSRMRLRPRLPGEAVRQERSATPRPEWYTEKVPGAPRDAAAEARQMTGIAKGCTAAGRHASSLVRWAAVTALAAAAILSASPAAAQQETPMSRADVFHVACPDDAWDCLPAWRWVELLGSGAEVVVTGGGGLFAVFTEGLAKFFGWIMALPFALANAVWWATLAMIRLVFDNGLIGNLASAVLEGAAKTWQELLEFLGVPGTESGSLLWAAVAVLMLFAVVWAVIHLRKKADTYSEVNAWWTGVTLFVKVSIPLMILVLMVGAVGNGSAGSGNEESNFHPKRMWSETTQLASALMKPVVSAADQLTSTEHAWQDPDDQSACSLYSGTLKEGFQLGESTFVQGAALTVARAAEGNSPKEVTQNEAETALSSLTDSADSYGIEDIAAAALDRAAATGLLQQLTGSNGNTYWKRTSSPIPEDGDLAYLDKTGAELTGMVSDMWEASYMTLLGTAQFGSPGVGKRAMCYMMELQRQTPPEEQRLIMYHALGMTVAGYDAEGAPVYLPITGYNSITGDPEYFDPATSCPVSATADAGFGVTECDLYDEPSSPGGSPTGIYKTAGGSVEEALGKPWVNQAHDMFRPGDDSDRKRSLLVLAAACDFKRHAPASQSSAQTLVQTLGTSDYDPEVVALFKSDPAYDSDLFTVHDPADAAAAYRDASNADQLLLPSQVGIYEEWKGAQANRSFAALGAAGEENELTERVCAAWMFPHIASSSDAAGGWPYSWAGFRYPVGVHSEWTRQRSAITAGDVDNLYEQSKAASAREGAPPALAAAGQGDLLAAPSPAQAAATRMLTLSQTGSKVPPQFKNVVAMDRVVDAIEGNQMITVFLTGIVALLIAVMYLKAFGGAAMGLLIAQIALGFILVLLPLLLFAVALPVKAVDNVRRQLIRVSVVTLLSYQAFYILVVLLLLLTNQMQAWIGSLLTGAGWDDTWFSAVLLGTAPLVAFWVMRSALKTFGLGEIASMSGAAHFSAGLAAAGVNGSRIARDAYQSSGLGTLTDIGKTGNKVGKKTYGVGKGIHRLAKKARSSSGGSSGGNKALPNYTAAEWKQVLASSPKMQRTYPQGMNPAKPGSGNIPADLQQLADNRNSSPKIQRTYPQTQTLNLPSSYPTNSGPLANLSGKPPSLDRTYPQGMDPTKPDGGKPPK